MERLKVLDLFSGIGGFSLGFERTGGFVTTGFCDNNPHARQVLAKHWPEVPLHDDVCALGAGDYDVICGGFPCQDISLSGTGAGLEGARSGLWFQFLRLIGEVRPRWAIIENVAALRSRGLEEVLGGLAAIGYDAEWHCVPASAVGAPHRRDRVWIVAYPVRLGSQGAEPVGPKAAFGRRLADTGAPNVAHPNGDAGNQRGSGDPGEGPGGRDADRGAGGQDVAHPHLPRLEILLQGDSSELPPTERTHAWSVEPDVGRVAYGVPSRVDRITRLGNAVVPQIPEAIGRAILAYEAATRL